MPENISPEKKDKILKDAVGKLDTYNKEGLGIDKYSVDLKYWLESGPETKATLRGGNTITVEFENPTQVGILLDRMDKYGGGGDCIEYISIRVSTPSNEIVFHQLLANRGG